MKNIRPFVLIIAIALLIATVATPLVASASSGPVASGGCGN